MPSATPAPSPSVPYPVATGDGAAQEAPASAAAEADPARAERDRALAALLVQAAAGSSSAFEAFYEQTIGYAQALARRMLRASDELEDVLSNAYFQAWRELPRFDVQRGCAVTWLLMIVRTRALDALRQGRQRPETPGSDTLPDTPSEEPGPPDLLEAAQASRRLQAALAELGTQQRWLLGLAYFRGLSHSQIAEETGLPLGTVKSLILRAQARLRETLAAA